MTGVCVPSERVRCFCRHVVWGSVVWGAIWIWSAGCSRFLGCVVGCEVVVFLGWVECLTVWLMGCVAVLMAMSVAVVIISR